MLAPKPINLAVSCKHAEALLSEGIVAERQYLPDAFILKLTIERCFKVKNHYEFVIRVQGRSRFLSYLAEPSSFVTYICHARYSDLLTLHHALQDCIHAHSSQYHEPCALPAFPEKKWLGSAQKLAESRIPLLNQYFDTLFCRFGSLAIFAEPIVDFFAPTPATIMVVTPSKGRRNVFLNTMTRRVFARSQPPSRQSTVASSVVSNETFSCVSIKANCGKWKSSVPFDYVRNERLYRVDVANLYDPGKVPAENCFVSLDLASPFGFIFLVDYSCGERLEAATEQLLRAAEAGKNKLSRKPAVLIVGENPESLGKSAVMFATADSEGQSVAAVPAAMEIPAGTRKRLEASYRVGYAECSTICGDGVLEALDGLLDLLSAE